MINKRLMNLLKDSKKYVAQMVVWNWIALLCNVVFIFSFAYLLENLLKGSINTNMVIIAALIDLLVVCLWLCSKSYDYNAYQEDTMDSLIKHRHFF